MVKIIGAKINADFNVGLLHSLQKYGEFYFQKVTLVVHHSLTNLLGFVAVKYGLILAKKSAIEGDVPCGTYPTEECRYVIQR